MSLWPWCQFADSMSRDGWWQLWPVISHVLVVVMFVSSVIMLEWWMLYNVLIWFQSGFWVLNHKQIYICYLNVSIEKRKMLHMVVLCVHVWVQMLFSVNIDICTDGSRIQLHFALSDFIWLKITGMVSIAYACVLVGSLFGVYNKHVTLLRFKVSVLL